MSSSYEQIVITIIPMVTGTLSIVASSTIISKVLKSQSRLTTPYNRLLVGLCTFDIIASICHAFSTLPIPRGSPDHWLALGDKATCSIQGTLMVFAQVGTPFYNVGLCIYFLCVVKYNMTDERFRKLWEAFLHAFPILYGLITSIGTFIAGYINPSFAMCYIYSSTDDPKEIKNAQRLMWIINGVPVTLIFILINAIMASILYTVYRQERTMERYRFQVTSGIVQSTRNSIRRSSEISSRSRRRLDAVKSRAICFFAAYMITFLPTLVFQSLASRDEEGGFSNVPFAISIAARTFLPLQGVFNLCAHLQPQVKSIKSDNPRYWYFRALYVALSKLDVDLDNRVAARGAGTRRRRASRESVITTISPRTSSSSTTTRSQIQSLISLRSPPSQE